MTRATRTRGEWRPAATLPVARVAVDVALAHLDRPFDYRVPAHLDDVAVPGVRVRVRFAGRLVDGFLLERVADSDHVGRLAWVDKVVSPEPVLTRRGRGPVPGGGRPVRRACWRTSCGSRCRPGTPGWRPSRRLSPAATRSRAREPPAIAATGWGAVPARAGAARRAGGGPGGARRLAGAARRVVGGPARRGRRRHRRRPAAVLCSSCPDQRDVAALHARVRGPAGGAAVVALTAELGPAERYRRWLAGAPRRGAGRGGHPVGRCSPRSTGPGCSPSGTTATTCTRSPARPTRTSATCSLLRAHAAGAALLVGGFARTAEAQVLVESGWAQEVVADRATRAGRRPAGHGAERDREPARPRSRTRARRGCRPSRSRRPGPRCGAGRPVLVQVPRAGYLPWLACAHCRETARCRHCAGPLALPGGAGRRRTVPAVRPVRGCRSAAGAGAPSRRSAARCARRGGCGPGSSAPGGRPRSWAAPSPGRRCAPRAAARRCSTACPAGPTWWSPPPARSRPRRAGTGRRCCSTGGRCCRGPDLRVAEETLRRWMARGGAGGAGSRRGPAGPGGRGRGRGAAAGAGAGPLGPGLARRRRAGRAHRGRVPARGADGVGRGRGPGRRRGRSTRSWAGRRAAGLGPPGVEVLGPVELDPEPGAGPRRARPGSARSLRVPRAQGRALAAALPPRQALRSARKAPDPVRVRLDPPEVG